MKTYTLHLPAGYQPTPLPGRNEWTADLRANPDKQTTGYLGIPEGPNCCLGRLSLLQGRLTKKGHDGTDMGDMVGSALNKDNPLAAILSFAGYFPDGVRVSFNENDYDAIGTCLAECNDAGLTFDQIADIIEAIWSDDGPLMKEERR